MATHIRQEHISENYVMKPKLDYHCALEYSRNNVSSWKFSDYLSARCCYSKTENERQLTVN